jgi:hypothetical protein
MMTPLLHQVLRSPIQSVIEGFRLWRLHGVHIRRARKLCQYADGIQLRRVRGWEERSLRLYRRAAAGLLEFVEPEHNAGAHGAQADHHLLSRIQRPYRAFATGLVVLAGALAVTIAVVLLVGSALSPSLRSRLFPHDLAAGKPWHASSADFGLPGNGLGPSSKDEVFFHTADENNPFVEIDLGAKHTVRNVLVENRPTFRERALPLNVEIFDGAAWQLVAQRRAAFSTWKYDIGPVQTQRVRFLRPGSGCFHLKRVSIYGQ